MTNTRTEHDLIGELAVPLDAYYGIHSLRAARNFCISGTAISAYPDLLAGLACVKQAAALTNRELGTLSADKADAVVRACDEIRGGALHDQFIVDVLQGGAGTSTNMNANEVIANRALELLGHPVGAYQHLHPVEDVNKSQSTNDVYPTAVKVALWTAVGGLLDAMALLRGSLEVKAREFADVVKVGRTQLQDAVPMTLGQEFTVFARTVASDELRLAEARDRLTTINLGGTAIGTGLTAPEGYAERACAHLSALAGIPLTTAADLIEATQDTSAFVELSAALRRSAIRLSKICNDLRLLASGPRSGLAEITLPAVQGGSSIMPGKVNPVIPEAVNQVAFEVIGNDMTVCFAAEAGQFQLNAFEPVIAHSLLKSVAHLRQGCRVLAERCIDGITADPEMLRERVERSIGLVTALNPLLGYARTTAIAEEARATGESVYSVVSRNGLLDDVQLRRLLHRERSAP